MSDSVQCPIFSSQPMSDQLLVPGWFDPLQGSDLPPNQPPLQRQHRLHVIIIIYHVQHNYHPLPYVQDHPDSPQDEDFGCMSQTREAELFPESEAVSLLSQGQL